MALVVKNAVKSVVKGKHNISADFYDALEKKVKEIIMEAAERAKANGRKTIQARDL
ncbi:MAG: DUF1931 family protein [Candidatus Aenigmarchaeota archaeon]|nr:DUF1931 family protein [Candidatus Aenigmarchaeota archaeon]